MKYRIRVDTLVRLALLGLIALLAYRFIDFRAVARGLLALPADVVAALVAIAALDRILMAIKWRQLLGRAGARVPLRRFVSVYFSASFLVYCLPNTVGGDVYRGARIAAAMPGKRERVFASLIMEKVVGLAASLLFAWAGLIWLVATGDAVLLRTVSLILAALTAAGLAGFSLSLWRGTSGLAVSGLRRLGAERASGLLQKVHGAYRSFTRRRSLLAQNLALTCVEQWTQLLVWLLAAAHLGIAVDLATLLAALAVVTLVRRASILVDSWGLATAATVATLSLAGIDPSTALLVTIVSHAASLAACLPGGALVAAHALRGRRLFHA